MLAGSMLLQLWWVVVGCLSVRVQASGSLPPVSYSHRVVLDQKGDYVMLWTPQDDRIDFEVQVGTTGYVGLGFSPNGGMKGADIVLGWVDATGQVFLHDRHATGNFAPIVDESQDVELLGGYQNDTHTVLRFSRRWTTLDFNNDYVLTDDTVRVIWAYSSEDPEDETTVRYHEARGTKSLYLREPQFTLPPLTPDVQTWDVLAPNVSVPSDLHTLYWCKMYKIPPLTNKNHIIGYIPVIEEKNLEHVHHIVMYECTVPNSGSLFEKWLDWTGTQCHGPNMPPSWQYCSAPIIAWGVGGQGEMFPEHVGFPMGEEHGGVTYLVMETHYDNPNFRQGIFDSSGLRVFYTQNLRQYDAGILTLGHAVSPYHIIPPGQKWLSAGYCDGSCTQKELPRDGIQLFQGFLHTHLLGDSIILRHGRDGLELPPILKDMNFDFNYQHTRILRNEVTLLPGDTIITECHYDSSSNTGPTFGGLSTKEEMCLAFMAYYPRINLSFCVSKPQEDGILAAMGIEKVTNKSTVYDMLHPSNKMDEEAENQLLDRVKSGNTSKPEDMNPSFVFTLMNITAPQKYLNMTFYDVLHDKEVWRNDQVTSDLQNVVLTGNQVAYCLTRSKGRDLTPDGIISAPNLTPLPRTLPDIKLMHRVVLDQKGSYVLLWTPRENDIVFEVQVGTTGYVGLGFSPNGGMKGADIVLGWVDATGQVLLHDRHAIGNSIPIVDESQDVELLGGYQNDTHTVLRFSRPWDTCDSAHDLKLSDDTVRVIWAYSSQDPEDKMAVRYHEARGTKSLYLREPQFTLPPLTPDVRSWDFLAPNVSLPSDSRTLYWCKIFKAPPFTVKNHMIGYIPVIEEKNLEFVHHILFYECDLPDTEQDFDKWVDWEGTQCYWKNMPASWKYCKAVLVGWAVGGEGEMLPEHVGLPMGGEYGGATYYMMELHYDNPNMRPGIVDASGIRLFFTEELRQYDAGTLLLGHNVTPLQVIPPGQERWVSGSFCDSSCTQQGLPTEGVKLFQGILHTHLLGSAVTVRHIRGGRELPVILEDLAYDFNYQHTRILKREVAVLPGDTLLTECTYDSRGHRVPTFGGLGTDEEMCLAFMFYYPRLNSSRCLSAPQIADVGKSLGAENFTFLTTRINEVKRTEEDPRTKNNEPKATSMSEVLNAYIITEPEKNANRSFLDLLNDEATWRDGAAVAAMQEMVNSGTHTTTCLGKGFNDDKKKLPYPTYIPLEQEADHCSSKTGTSGLVNGGLCPTFLPMCRNN